MRKNILVFNVELSGVNEFIFSQLKKKGWELNIVNVPSYIPKIDLIKTVISDIRPDIYQWKKEVIYHLNKSSTLSFIQRTKFCQKKIKETDGQFDIILQFLGQFAPTVDYNQLNKPYVIFHDYTMAQNLRYLDRGFPSDTPVNEIFKWLALETQLYSNADYIFTPAYCTTKSFIIDYKIEQSKVITLSYGTKFNSISTHNKTYDNQIILFVGKQFRRKGGFILLKAFEQVRKELKNSKLIIIGTEKNKINCDQSGVEILGQVHDSILKKLYEQATIFVMPSFCEPFGLVFLEAMSYKLPCIGTTIDAMSEIIVHEKTGYLIPPGDFSALAEKILLLLKNPNLCEKMGSEGKNRVKVNYSWDALGEKLDLYLTKCILQKNFK